MLIKAVGGVSREFLIQGAGVGSLNVVKGGRRGLMRVLDSKSFGCCHTAYVNNQPQKFRWCSVGFQPCWALFSFPDAEQRSAVEFVADSRVGLEQPGRARIGDSKNVYNGKLAEQGDSRSKSI
eukprot:scaffold1194_cov127-Cylindrotheca_fusiformis.AAC.25